MTDKRESLQRKIAMMRGLLNKLLEIEAPTSKRILRVSQKLDRLIVEYYKTYYRQKAG